MSLNDQLNSFKNKVRNAATAQKRTIDIKQDESPKKVKLSSRGSTPAANAVMTPAAIAASSTHKSTLLFHAVEYVKKQDRDVKFSEIESYLSTPIEALIGFLRGIDRIQINEKEKTARYVSIYGIYSSQDLLTYLRAQRTFRATPVNKLQDGWNGCLQAIEELEKREQIIVLHNKKDNSPQYVWANVGGSLGQIDAEFVSLWHQAKVPETTELPTLLTSVNLKPTSVDPATVKKELRGSGQDVRKPKKKRPAKITNTHLQGVLKDYEL